MLLNIVIATALMMGTTAVHAAGMMWALSLRRKTQRLLIPQLQHSPVYQVSRVVILMFCVSLVEVLLWAATYLALNAIEGFEKAVYFSMVTFTTLGYGEIVLDERWRLLASFEAANGIIMFGWTAAIVIASVQRVYFGKEDTR